MSFDKATRNALAKMVGQVRERLKSDVMDQLRRLGFQSDGTVLDLDVISGLSESEREAGRELRDQLAHFISLESGAEAARRQAAYERLAREIGFTTLNRLVALRMAEERGLIVESVGKGLASAGFQIYERVARDALGTRAETYRAYLECLYDELALDLPLLFDRMTPESRIFPSERCLEDVLAQLTDPALAHLWKEDEAIGWVYQYYNDPAERKKMRDASQAPRNSRELAVRNQFFTPRYVVEFLTDNTLGRLWYEMRRGETRLADDCRYLVRRKHPIWLPPGQLDLRPFDASQPHGVTNDASERAMWTRPNPTFEKWEEIQRYALTVDGYTYAQEHGMGEAGELANSRLHEYADTGTWRGSFEDLRTCLFFEQRRWRHFGRAPEGEDLKAIQALYEAICGAWDREADVIAYRPKKDPRDLKILDPACGSGHFLLYAFDLLETIYVEAWEDNRSPASEVTGTRLRDDYLDLDALRRDVPGLILRYNLHGVDIDPRACQITALALWLRAQRSYQQLGLKPAERPPITKSNIVCAEPMPGEREMLEEYLRKHVDPRLHDLVRVIWDKMRLAGEAGTLLKIEQEIEAELRAARERAMVEAPAVQVSLFQKGQPVVQERMTFSTAEERAFWAEAQGKLFAALRDYAAQATNGHATQRRLFKEDAEQGFAFVDMCRQPFDVVLMNPPFGNPPVKIRTYLSEAYPKLWPDLYSAFIQRTADLLVASGRLGAITSRTFLALSSFEPVRELLLNVAPVQLIVECGLGVLDDATVRAAFYVAERAAGRRNIVAFWDLRRSEDRGHDLLAALNGFEPQRSYAVPLQRFREIPGKPFAYWLPDHLLKMLDQGPYLDPTRLSLPGEPGAARVAVGASTTDDPRFVRCHWEVPARAIGPTGWARFAHAIGFARYYSPTYAVLNWFNEGRELLSVTDAFGNVKPRLRCQEFFFQAGLVSPYISERGLGCSYLAVDHIVGNSCRAYFSVQTDSHALLAYLNSELADLFMWALTPDRKHEAGIIAALPVPDELATVLAALADLAGPCWQAIRDLRAIDETDPLHHVDLINWAARYNSSQQMYLAAQGKIDDLVGELLQSRAQLTQAAQAAGSPHDLRAWSSEDEELTSSNHISQPEDRGREFSRVAFSHATGACFGRWDIRIGSDISLAPQLADPFAPLPACAPGALVGPDGLPATSGRIDSEEWLRARPDAITLPPEGAVRQTTIADEEYPIRIAWDGILVDDPEHPADIVRRVREVLAVLWPGENGARAEAIEREACEILDVRELRDYFRRPQDFFEDHLKRYSKSRRQAPIYWPLSTASGSYTLWIYYHRLTSDTLYTAVNRYVDPKIAEVRRRLVEDERALESATGREASRLRASVEQGQAFLRELQEFRDELLRVAALPYRPDLNDGVIITAAPLHRLFRLPRWAKDTKACWDKLERGEYDWAHLAYTLWPDRVREKCRTDKSLAIAHGLEDLYVEPPASAKKSRGRQQVKQLEDELMDVVDDDE